MGLACTASLRSLWHGEANLASRFRMLNLFRFGRLPFGGAGLAVLGSTGQDARRLRPEAARLGPGRPEKVLAGESRTDPSSPPKF